MVPAGQLDHFPRAYIYIENMHRISVNGYLPTNFSLWECPPQVRGGCGPRGQQEKQLSFFSIGDSILVFVLVVFGRRIKLLYLIKCQFSPCIVLATGAQHYMVDSCYLCLHVSLHLSVSLCRDEIHEAAGPTNAAVEAGYEVHEATNKRSISVSARSTDTKRKAEIADVLLSLFIDPKRDADGTEPTQAEQEDARLGPGTVIDFHRRRNGLGGPIFCRSSLLT